MVRSGDARPTLAYPLLERRCRLVQFGGRVGEIDENHLPKVARETVNGHLLSFRRGRKVLMLLV